MRKVRLYLKHSMSCLRDQPIEVDIDEARRQVRMSVRVFDSALVATAVTRILPDEHQVTAFRDDNQKEDATWLTQRTDYELFIAIADVEYRAQVVRLFGGREVAVTLEPGRATWSGT